jgi:LEA14-like dessication related protein
MVLTRKMNFTIKKAVFAFLIVSVGTGATLYATGVIQKPSYGIQDKGDWGEIENNTVNVISSVYVYNPNSFGLNLSNVNASYSLKMNDVLLAEGSKAGISIPEEENKTINLVSRLKTEKVPEWWVSHLQNSESSEMKIPVKIDAGLFSRNFSFSTTAYTDTIETDIDSQLGSSFSNVEGNYSWSPTGTEIGETRIVVDDVSAYWGEVDMQETDLMIDMEIRNPNSYPIPVPQLKGGLEMNEVSIAEWDANNVEITNAAQDAMIQPGETQEITVKASMDNDKINDWFLSHVANDEKTDANTDIKFAFDIAGQTLTFPQDGMNCRFEFQTAILEDNQEAGGSFNGCDYSQMQSDSSSQEDEDGSTENSTEDGLVEDGLL